MATNTYVALDKITVSGSSTSSVTFSSINQGYTDLRLVCSVSSSAGNALLVRLNGVTGSVYSQTRILGTGSAASSVSSSNLTRWASDAVATTAGVFGVCTIDLLNYSNTTTYKTALFRDNSDLYVEASVKLWRGSTGSSTEAVTSITLFPDSGNWTAGTTFSLYGIAAQTVPGTAKATGGTITYDAYGNVIHTFTSSGTFTPSVPLSCEYLVVAGGGGGGADGGGGGAGGYLTNIGGSPLSLTATGYSVTVGAGGSSSTYNSGGPSPRGGTGSNSVLSSITSYGGGGGGGAGSNSPGNNDGGPGASGGGGSNYGDGTGGAATPAGQGNVGGAATGSSPYYPGGSGGGAGAAGAKPASGSVVVAGGVGLSNSISGTSTYYAGGGGGAANRGISGGAGGTGGGGAGGGGGSGSNGSAGTAGTVNTGGAGGAGGGAANGAAGGSGIVIIRYSGV